ncbi:unnamed protein product [Lactuca virosa]|uniref:RING-type E3 ubiquitin transferase n=1 Tax=Lactuca virosa TaxID=75947 RepID=A0AAU9MKQ0_9ASTR|nr:unnamed protein product [Lactuca virosa]
MDVDYSKQAVGGIAAPKKRSVTALKDTAGSQNGSPQFCNRIGCCGRLNHTKLAKNKCLEKPKASSSKPSFRSSSLKEVTGSSSKTCSSVTNVKKSPSESEKKKIERIPKESSSLPKESGIQERKLKSRNTEVSSSSSRVKKVYTQSGSSVMENSQNESNNGRRRRFFQGESSSSGKGKRVIGVSANEGRPVVSTSGISISDPKNSRNWTACRANSVSSVRTKRSLKMDPSKESIDLSSVNSADVVSDSSHAETLSSSEETSVTSSDHPVVRFVNQNGTRSYNIDGIADVLLALDRIEQNEELTYEQLLSLEANLFLGGLNLYDQHRDMRLDIDNMSYEELLALEEKMGTVNTALSEEELSKCIRKSVYESDEKMRHSLGAEDNKCSICQEEFVRGDEIGRLGCKHGYHNSCINQWLALKNWCPICKSSPKPSSSSSLL